MKFKSYAKINLALNVLNKRYDGFHNLEMIVVPIELHDLISLKPIKKNSYVVCKNWDSKMSNDENLCIKALKFFNDLYHKNQNYKITIKKNIPVGAGLGGGSSNGGTLFKQLCILNHLTPTEEDLKILAKKIGADVPFFVRCKPSKIFGIGDEIFPINFRGSYHCLIVMPEEGLSTKKVFEMSDKINLQKYDINLCIQDLQNEDLRQLGVDSGNALEEVSFKLNNDIKHIIDFLNSNKVEVCHMSGSGSAVFSISKNLSLLKKISKNIKKQINCKTFLTKILN